MIQGDKVRIRKINLNDADLLCKWWSNGEVMQHVGFTNGVKTDIGGLKDNIKNQLNDMNKYRKSRMFIVLDKNTEERIGELVFHDLDLENKSCTIGIKICEVDYQGKGYGEDTLRTFLTYLFKEFNLHRIELDTLFENTRARNLYKKVGFKEIGIRRDAWIDAEKNYRSFVLMDILEKEMK